MNVEAGIVKTAFEKKTPFFNKTKILAERKVRKGIIYKQQAESGNRYPEQHPEKDFHRFLKGEYSCVLHTVVCDIVEMPR